MQEVNLFIHAETKGIKASDGAAGYLFEAQTPKGPATMGRVYRIENSTSNAAELAALLDALKRLRRPCSVRVYTESTYISSAIDNGWLEDWAENGWKTRRGKNVANSAMWEKLRGELEVHKLTFTKAEGEYGSWLKCEVERKVRTHV